LLFKKVSESRIKIWLLLQGGYKGGFVGNGQEEKVAAILSGNDQSQFKIKR
jgi:hypothetical protein